MLFSGYGLQCYSCHPSQQSGKKCKNLDEAVIKTCNAGEQLCLIIDLDGGNLVIEIMQQKSRPCMCIQINLHMKTTLDQAHAQTKAFDI